MPADGPTESQLRQACADLDRRLRCGERCGAERFFADMPLLASNDDHAVELIYTEFVTREELGQQPTPQEFFARFPYWRSRLERQFQIHDLLRDNLNNDGDNDEPEFLAPPAEEAEARDEPRRLGNYELQQELARGGCGVVYRAWQHGLDRVVAVKVLREDLARSRRARRRFCHEARVMASLRHRHIMPIHDIGFYRGVIYFSMDFAPASLARPAHDYDAPAAARLLETVARAVHHAHQQGVIHCDLKPSNILLDEHGEPLVSDFGLARLPTGDEKRYGPLVGTPAYMAPEQIDERHPVGPATDVWALGVILYELLTGERPFAAASLVELQDLICEATPLPPRQLQATLDARLEAICLRCLAKDPGGRFTSAEELAGQLCGWDQR
jgi:eukaryotic-like serine/threonine-protein kinase